MQIGIFSTVFERGSLPEKLDAVRDCGFSCVQFHMQCAGVDPMPEAISGSRSGILAPRPQS